MSGIATGVIGIGTATLGTPNGPGESPISGSFIYQWYDEDGKLEKHYRKARKDYKNAG